MTTKKKVSSRPKAPAVPTKALLEIADWLLDLAATAAYGCHDDLGSVERVRRFLHATADKKAHATPTEEQFLTVIAMAVMALEKRHGLRGLGDQVALGLDAATYGPRAPRVAHHVYLIP
jgi:hypothetical protein